MKHGTGTGGRDMQPHIDSAAGKVVVVSGRLTVWNAGGKTSYRKTLLASVFGFRFLVLHNFGESDSLLLTTERHQQICQL